MRLLARPTLALTFQGCRRGGFSLPGLLLALGVVASLLVIAWFTLPSFSFSAQDGAGVMTTTVERKEFIHDVTERGSLESASNVDIRCEVESKGSAGTTILEIVPEGTYIEPEDVNKKVLVRLDSSMLKEQENQQKIVCANSEAAVAQAQNVFDTAEISRREYLEGTYEEQKLNFKIQISEAEVACDQQDEYLAFSRKLERKGYITKQQLETEETKLEKAQNQLELLRKQRDVYGEFTKPRMVGQLEADINIAKAKLAAEQASHELDLEKLKLIQEQIVKCTILAPEPGQVVYANLLGHRGDREVVIEEGAIIRENQVIIRLPDPKRMQVTAKINEARIALIEDGMSATLQLDAFPEIQLAGIVEEVSPYPAPTSFFRADVKEYETVIQILDPQADLPEGQTLRPGLTAQVKIRVEHLDDVLQVPVQALIEHGGKHYCVLRDGRGFKAQQVTIGPSNDKVVVIEKGLEDGQQVVLNANKYRDDTGLAKAPDKAGEKRARTGPTDGRPSEPPGAQRAGAEERRGAGERPGAEDRRGGRDRPGPPSPAQAFKQMDRNGDGKLQKDELPAQFQALFATADANKDGAIDAAELGAAMAKLRSGAGRQGPPPGAGP